MSWQTTCVTTLWFIPRYHCSKLSGIIDLSCSPLAHSSPISTDRCKTVNGRHCWWWTTWLVLVRCNRMLDCRHAHSRPERSTTNVFTQIARGTMWCYLCSLCWEWNDLRGAPAFINWVSSSWQAQVAHSSRMSASKSDGYSGDSLYMPVHTTTGTE